MINRFAQSCALLLALAASAFAESSGNAELEQGGTARIRTTAYTATERNGGKLWQVRRTQ